MYTEMQILICMSHSKIILEVDMQCKCKFVVNLFEIAQTELEP